MKNTINILPRNRPDCVILIDAADEALVCRYRWTVVKRFRSLTNYAVTDVDGKQVYLHRFILGAAKGQIVNHLDGNGLNCSRSNMVLCTQAENVRHAITLPGRFLAENRKRRPIPLNKVMRRLRDGSLVHYVYNRATGELLERWVENK